jgi:class 3 adenylate cyclase
MPVCSACSQRNPGTARFCLACGVRLVADASRAADTRKTVTVLFCDVSGSTRLGEHLDPESLREVMGSYFGLVEGVVERHGGVVEKSSATQRYRPPACRCA